MMKMPPLHEDLSYSLLRTEGAIYWLNVSEDNEVTVVPTYHDATLMAWESPWMTAEGDTVYGLIDEDGNEVGITRRCWPEM